MDDLFNLAKHLDLSPIIAVLLAAIGFVLKLAFKRIETNEVISAQHSRSIAWIKGKLSLGDEEE